MAGMAGLRDPGESKIQPRLPPCQMSWGSLTPEPVPWVVWTSVSLSGKFSQAPEKSTGWSSPARVT